MTATQFVPPVPESPPTPLQRDPAERSRRPILVVDDEQPSIDALRRVLRHTDYELHAATSGETALQMISTGSYEVVLCDVCMPGMDGLGVLNRALALDPDLAILMLTGLNDAPTATTALSNGASDYLMKPIRFEQFAIAIERAVHQRARRIEQREVQRLIREEVAVRTAALEREQQALRDLSVSIVETLINAMEAKDLYLRGHSVRTAELAAAIADELGLDADTVEAVRLAGRLHDVGKIGIREAILNKPDRLTAEEYAHIKDHVRIGMEILAPLRHLGVALEFVHDHHERWAGGGYPRGLAGDAISIGGQILAAVDAYDALTSKRAYRDSRTPEETLAYLQEECVGSLLNPRIFSVLRDIVQRRQSLVFVDVE